MADAIVPVDLRNPGQVFACLGLMEAAEILLGPADGGYVWTGRETRVTFRLSVDGPADPVLEVVRFLASAEVKALAPAGSGLAAKEPSVAALALDEGVFPCPRPGTPSALPALLVGADGLAIPLGHWADGPASGRDSLKFWAGASGYSGAALTRDALDLIRLGGNALAEAMEMVRVMIERVVLTPFPAGTGLDADLHGELRASWRSARALLRCAKP